MCRRFRGEAEYVDAGTRVSVPGMNDLALDGSQFTQGISVFFVRIKRASSAELIFYQNWTRIVSETSCEKVASQTHHRNPQLAAAKEAIGREGDDSSIAGE